MQYNSFCCTRRHSDLVLSTVQQRLRFQVERGAEEEAPRAEAKSRTEQAHSFVCVASTLFPVPARDGWIASPETVSSRRACRIRIGQLRRANSAVVLSAAALREKQASVGRGRLRELVPHTVLTARVLHIPQSGDRKMRFFQGIRSRVDSNEGLSNSQFLGHEWTFEYIRDRQHWYTAR